VCGTLFRPTKGNANRYCSRDCMLKVGGNRRNTGGDVPLVVQRMPHQPTYRLRRQQP
jgi:hypothetical protein